MKKYILSFFLLILVGCGSIKYDSATYTKFVNIMATLSKPDTFCDPASVKKNVAQLYDDTHWITIYQGGQPDNTDIILIMGKIEEDIIRFRALVNAGPISPEYCRSKLENLVATWQYALVAEGSKPR